MLDSSTESKEYTTSVALDNITFREKEVLGFFFLMNSKEAAQNLRVAVVGEELRLPIKFLAFLFQAYYSVELKRNKKDVSGNDFII